MRETRGVRGVVATVLVAAVVVSYTQVVAAPTVGGAPAESAERVVTYSLDRRGAVGGDPAQFAAAADATLRDPRGWSLGGAIEFRPVPAGGDFTLWLATPAEVAAAAPICSSGFSCRVGRDVFINDERWRTGADSWDEGVDNYRSYVILHEVGHWLGLGHQNCAGPGRSAPVMQQQSISLQGCTATVWPSVGERDRIAREQGVTLRPSSVEARYRELGAEGGPLGPPLSWEQPTGDGASQRFRAGEIFSSPTTGAHALSGAILARYRELDGAAGRLGLPTSGERVTGDARVTTFSGSDGGAIHWTPRTGAHEVYGAIHDRYAALGGVNGTLGHPVSGEYDDGDGRRSDFEHGHIEWTLADGPHAVITG